MNVIDVKYFLKVLISIKKESALILLLLHLKIQVLLLAEGLLGHNKGTQPLPGHVAALLVQPVVVLHDACHHHVSALQVKCDLASSLLLDNDSHPLGLGGEWENLQDCVVEHRAGGGAQLHRRKVSVDQGQARFFSPFHQRNLDKKILIRDKFVYREWG
jgi:hypothetical protein